MRRMLDPKEAGGSLPSTITFDENGNRTASKDLKVDGKLKLKSLISDTNPDGDITKELGGGGGGGSTIHRYLILIDDMIQYEVSTTEDFGEINKAINIYDFWNSAKYQPLRNGGVYPSSGIYTTNDKIIVPSYFEIKLGMPHVIGYDIKANSRINYTISTDSQVKLVKMY